MEHELAVLVPDLVELQLGDDAAELGLVWVPSAGVGVSQLLNVGADSFNLPWLPDVTSTSASLVVLELAVRGDGDKNSPYLHWTAKLSVCGQQYRRYRNTVSGGANPLAGQRSNRIRPLSEEQILPSASRPAGRG